MEIETIFLFVSSSHYIIVNSEKQKNNFEKAKIYTQLNFIQIYFNCKRCKFFLPYFNLCYFIILINHDNKLIKNDNKRKSSFDYTTINLLFHLLIMALWFAFNTMLHPAA